MTTRNEKAIAENNSIFIDEHRLFMEDEEWEHLRHLTVSTRSIYARSFHLEACTEVMEIGRNNVPIVYIEEKGSSESTGYGTTGPKPVHIGA